MRALVACLVCLVGCASSTYLEPLGEPAPDAAAETLADVAAPAPDAPAADVARVEPAREVSVQVEAAAPDAGAPEAAVEAAVLDVAADAPEAIEAAADVVVEVAPVDAGPARTGEACGPQRRCDGDDLPYIGSGGLAHRCVTDLHAKPLGPGLEPIATSCVPLCRIGGTTGTSSGCGTGCCATIGEDDAGLINACMSRENCK